ncbi:MAG: hypothetical protein AB1468_03545 [Candidatus Micrarchaeota archaeon]
MKKKKVSLLGGAWGAARFAFGVIGWIAKKVWAFFVWLLNLLKNLLKKAQESRRLAEVERSRPVAKAAYLPLKGMAASEGELNKFESRLYSDRSLIGLILGSRGSGKSALGMRVLENVVARTGRKAYCMGFDRKDLPAWVEPVESLEQVRNNSFLLVDEGGVEFSSRSAMSSANRLLGKLLLISRHKDINVLFISQNSANLEVNAIRQSDYLLLKPPSLLQLDFERKAIRDIYERVKDKFVRYRSERGILYVYSDQYRGFASNGLPSFWSESLSKSYRNRK